MYERLDLDRAEQHLLQVALEERIRERWRNRKWYRRTRSILKRPGWRVDAYLNDAVLVELLTLRRTAKRAGARVLDGMTASKR